MVDQSFVSRLAEIRAEAGMTQAALAAAAGVSRQALGLIESGRSVPSTALALRLAALLGKRVEDLFALEQASPEIDVQWADGEPPSPARSTRGRLGLVGKHWVAHAIDPTEVAAADVIRDRPGPDGRSRLLQPRGLESLRDRLLISGCAPALGVLVEHLRRGLDPVDAVWIHATTGAALGQLTDGQTHVAGVHFVAGDRANARRGRWRSVTLARWRQGLLVRRERQAPRSIDDLARRGLRLARREPGASANRLLDQTLQRAGVRPGGDSVQSRGHLGVAQAVALGAADTGVAAEPAAIAHHLGFIPLDEERFDSIFDRAGADDRRLVRLGEVLASAAFRQDLASLGGYDTASTGTDPLADEK